MTFELLVSCVQKDPHKLVEQMNIESDAIIVSQKEEIELETEFESGDNRIRYFRRSDQGVGRSRNYCLRASDANIVLFADEDIVYEHDYQKKILDQFEAHPKADILLFNVKVCDERRTYWNKGYRRVRWYNCGRYPAYSIAVKRGKYKHHTPDFSHLFGGGAPFSNGEDSLFLMDCLRKKKKIYTVDTVIGEEIPRPSTWFFGYNDKFFYDRGVLYYHLYGSVIAIPFALRWLLKMKKEYSKDYSFKNAKKMLFMGLKDGRTIKNKCELYLRTFKDGKMISTDKPQKASVSDK